MYLFRATFIYHGLVENTIDEYHIAVQLNKASREQHLIVELCMTYSQKLHLIERIIECTLLFKEIIEAFSVAPTKAPKRVNCHGQNVCVWEVGRSMQNQQKKRII